MFGLFQRLYAGNAVVGTPPTASRPPRGLHAQNWRLCPVRTADACPSFCAKFTSLYLFAIRKNPEHLATENTLWRSTSDTATVLPIWRQQNRRCGVSGAKGPVDDKRSVSHGAEVAASQTRRHPGWPSAPDAWVMDPRTRPISPTRAGEWPCIGSYRTRGRPA